jgi:hypothetical protein
MADTLRPGESLSIGQQLQSNNGRYILTMQADGNLVQYEGMPYAPSAVWATNTFALPPFFRPIRADMQQDGNLVLYTASNIPAWASNTDGHSGARLVLQDDRNLVIYDANDRPVWAHNVWLPVPAQRLEIRASKKEDVGHGKRMETQATLFRDGRLAVDSYTANNSWIGGLRGHIVVLTIDAVGRAIWVSQDFACATRCSVPDVSCASYGRQSFFEQFPAVVGQYAERLEIYHADAPSFVDLRNALIDGIKAVGDVAQGLKDEWERLQKS